MGMTAGAGGRGIQSEINVTPMVDITLLITGAPGAIPTRDLSLRRRALYAAELREHRW
jgi:hypothetical protein